MQQPSARPPKKKKVLFVCLGNSCRSQMAEGFARVLGSDVLEAASCGIAPAPSVSRLTRQVMAERGIDVSAHYPKSLGEVPVEEFDVVVNMSGMMLPVDVDSRLLHWDVTDPMGGPRELYDQVADRIRSLVEGLIEELRSRP